MLTLNRIVIVLGLLVASVFFGSAFSSDNDKPSLGKPGGLVTNEELGGDERYLLYASVDKPVYRENESVYLRATFLNASDNTPLVNGEPDINVQIKGPKGDIVFSIRAQGDDSTAATKWLIPTGTPGGRYTALVSSPILGAPQAERSFDIRAYRAPRLKTQIEFAREGYGPGDEVQASIKISRAEGGKPEGAKVTVIARVDGEQVFKKSGYRVAVNGVLSTKFSLPKSIEIGDGNLAFVIEDGGVVETASKTLPIILQTMTINFYPEGGDLVAGRASRVYVQANRPDGKPADIKGRVFLRKAGELSGPAVAELSTFHEGRGDFLFTPNGNANYVLVLDAPSGIDRQFPLPKAKISGTVLRSKQNVFAYNDAVSIQLSSVGEYSPAKLTLYKRNQLIDTQTVSAQGQLNPSTIQLDAKDAEGVLIVTAWSADNVPLAERLIYRQPKFAVNVSLQVSGDQHVPGSDVSVDILTTDENGKPVEAVVGLTVTDDAVLEIIEKREQAPRLPVMVYLENEVDGLADAHIYLDAENEMSPKAVDLLLGTQGWRRFILVDYTTLKAKNSEAAMRAMAERSAPQIGYALHGDDFQLEEVVVTGARKRRLFKNRAQPLEAPEPAPVAEVAGNAEAELNNEFKVDEALPALNDDIADQEFVLEANQAGAARKMGKIFQPRVPVSIREYAHQVRANRKANDRVDFTETLYWHKGIRTSARDGKATIKFGLSDSVTSFRVMGDAFGRNGALGSGDVLISSVEPFYIEAKMPLEASVGDLIELPVAMVNSSVQDIENVNLLVKGEGLNIQQAANSALNAGDRIRQVVRIVADKPGQYPLVLSAAAGPFADRVTRTLVVKPNGFPYSVNYGGLVGPKNGFETDIIVPNEIEPGSLEAIAKVYPSPLANMEEALNALLRQPSGCFEQTSSTNYPLVMAQQYFSSHQGIDPEKIAKAKALLNQGYKKLIGFESKDKGYEWFGANPAHEALTAYGLMEFVDMAKVMSVDDAMIKRTRSWLLERRDGEGGFKRNPKALDSFGGAPKPTTDAYIVWSLLESGESPSVLCVDTTACVEERVQKIVVEQLGVKAEEVTTEASFVDDLGADSLDTVELVMALEEEFETEIPDEDAEKITTVQEAVKYINANS